MAKRRVLIVYRSYFPALTHLGPATAIRSLVDNLADEYDFHILTLNFDFATGRPLFADRHHIAVTSSATIEYVPRGWRSLLALAKRLSQGFDVVDIHCAFDRRLAIPALVMARLGVTANAATFHTPHGIFMDTIMSARAALKKFFCLISDFTVLYRNITHLAGSEAEKHDIERRHRTAQSIRVTSQFFESAAVSSITRRKSRNSLRIAMVGRVAPQKNVTYAIDVLRQLKVPATLDIYGDTDDHAYVSQCREMMADSGKSIIRLAGNIDKTDLFETLKNYDVLLHPTLGENFGHAIVESLSLGLPVLASNRSPWTDLEEHKAGWSIPLSKPKAFAAQLERLYAMSDEWSDLSSGAISYVRKTFDREQTRERYRAAYGVGNDKP